MRTQHECLSPTELCFMKWFVTWSRLPNHPGLFLPSPVHSVQQQRYFTEPATEKCSWHEVVYSRHVHSCHRTYNEMCDLCSCIKNCLVASHSTSLFICSILGASCL
jgi:hypothetical protein